MSVYQVLNPLSNPPNASNVMAVQPGQSVKVWSAETPNLLSASQQVAPGNQDGRPLGFSVDGFFSGAPGTFEVDVQASADDVDAHYQTVANGNITTVDATNQTFHFDGTTVLARFVRLMMRARANAVTVTASISQ